MSRGHNRHVMHLVHDYFVARDKGWLGGQQTSAAVRALRREGGELADQPARLIDRTARVADEAATDTGLYAKDVRTGLGRRARVAVRGHRATVSVTAGSLVSWNNEGLGESSVGDVYHVELEREKKVWRIVHVAYAPIPDPDEDNGCSFDWRSMHAVPEDTRALGVGTYDRAAAAKYAVYWSKPHWLPLQTPYGTEWIMEEPYNPEYPRLDNDCTNFASQALHAGGWPKADGVDPDDLGNWTDDLWGPYGPSTTWSRAYRLWRYASDERRGERKGTWPSQDNEDIWHLQPGDLVFADWDPDGKADGRIDHAMVVTGSYTELGFTEPTYSQHTGLRTNLPLSIGMKIATAPVPPVDPGDGMGGQGRTVVWYPVHIKDEFTTG